MVTTLTPWIIFNIFVVTMLALDLLVLHKKNHVISIKEALGWSAFWISLALIFNAGIYYYLGAEAALDFLTGYLIEESLSVDNLFVFIMIFAYFRTPQHLQYKVLFWGILGAIIMRALFITAGITLIHYFEGALYIFAVFLIYAGYKMAFKSEEEEMRPSHNPVLKIVKRLVPVTEEYEGEKFFVKRASKIFATPLFIVLISIETTDVIFALDSIPAILAITTDPFLVYTSNIFAILGLRALFFAIAGLIQIFHFLHFGLAFILTFIGMKMLIAGWIKIPTGIALSVTLLSLVCSVVLSILYPQKKIR